MVDLPQQQEMWERSQPSAVVKPPFDPDEEQATLERQLKMLENGANAASDRQGGASRSAAAKMRALETELSRAARDRDLLREVALSAEAKQEFEEERARELRDTSERAAAELVELEDQIDRRPLSRAAQPPEDLLELAKRTTRAQVAFEVASAQQAVADRETKVHLYAKQEADKAERDYHASAEVREALSREQQKRATNEHSAAVQKAATEAAFAGRMEAHHKARAAQRELARQQLREKAEKQLRAAKEARGAAAERTNKLVRDAAPALEEVRRMRDEAHAQRIECVLQLKADTEAAAALIRGRNEKRAAKILREEAEHKAEKEQLAAKGLNPYKVFKQRAVAARAAQEEKRQENKIRRRKEELERRLNAEENMRQREDAAERKDREHEQRFRDELGKHVTDARNREYLRAKTVDGTDVLDPSGKCFRVQPSQVTTIKDAAFGLGYHPRKTPEMAAAVVDLVASKPRHAGQGAGDFIRLVPKDVSNLGDDGVGKREERVVREREGGDEATLANSRGDTRLVESGKGVAAAHQAKLMEEMLPSPFSSDIPGAGISFVEDTGASSASAEIGKELGESKNRRLSTFERQSLQKARARQVTRMETGEPQVAAGRIFKDRPAFISKPERIVFKDFFTGKVHKRRVVLTNASLTFNSLKVCEIDDEYKRFFEVSYSKPGRLSAGMTCAIDIAFHPKIDEDIFTELPIRTQTGPMTIPVECTARRIKPSISAGLVTFCGTIMGETETARVYVHNNGALPTTFRLANIVGTGDLGRGDGSPSLATRAAFSTNASAETCQQNQLAKEGKNVSENDTESSSGARDDAPDPSRLASDCFRREGNTNGAELRKQEEKEPLVVQGGGALAGYGSAEILITFAPLRVGQFTTVQAVCFEGTPDEFPLVVEASSAPVAVYPAERDADLRCCVYGKLYLKKIRICNRGKIAMKAIARVPPPLRGCASFIPDMGFVQPESFFEFGLRFRPDIECLARCVRDGFGAPVPSPPERTRNLLYAAAEGEPSKDERTADPEGRIAVPVRFEVPGQALPANIVVKATLTGAKVQVGYESGQSGGALDFGRCFLGQSMTRRIALRNTSLLPLRFGFVGIPTEVRASAARMAYGDTWVDVQPADGFGVLMPKETSYVNATFSPASSVLQDATMTFRTSLGQTSTIRYRGCGVDPVVNLSHTVLHLAPCCEGDCVTSSVFLKNLSQMQQCLEFVAPTPASSFLTICPSVALLPPGRDMRVEVSFSPPVRQRRPGSRRAAKETVGQHQEDDIGVDEDRATPSSVPQEGIGEKCDSFDGESFNGLDARAQGNTTTIPSNGPAHEGVRISVPPIPLHVGTLEEVGVNATGCATTVVCDGAPGDGRTQETESWSRHGRWKVPCFLESSHDTIGDTLPPMALEVNTVVVERFLSVDKTCVEFGRLPVGSKAEATLRVRNAGDDEIPLEGHGMNAVGPFQVLNAFRTLSAHSGSHRCLLQFCPEAAGIVTETLVLSSPALGKTLRVRLRGEGVKPALTMEPSNGLLDMGYVLEGDTAERALLLRNESVFPVRYSTAPRGPQPPSNFNNVEVFAMAPCEGDVAAGQSVTVKATFSPDNTRMWPFIGVFKIEVKDQRDSGHTVRVRGFCSSRQLYIRALSPGQNPEDQVVPAAEDRVRAAARGSMEKETAGVPPALSQPLTGLPGQVSAPPPILLRFPKDKNGSGDAGSRDDHSGDDRTTSGPSVMQLVIGSLVTNDPKKASAGSFEVEFDAEAKARGYFAAVPDKGGVAPGANVLVSCSFEPPSPPRRLHGPAGGKGATPAVGQWYRTRALVHLKGGYRPTDASEILSVPVLLEGFVTV